MNTEPIHGPQERVLSLILCSRNDQYMGNSRWRFETALNYLAQNVHELGREEDVEVVVADWGSEIPLHTVLQLSPVAAGMVTFIVVPPALAHELQKDSPFSEVHALNAAARRANGQYIGRIDQDILVGKRFLNTFFELYEGKRQLDVPLDSALLFANRRSIPYGFAVRCPSLGHVSRFVRLFGPLLEVWKYNAHWPDVFWTSFVGMWLLHRDLWDESGGYDERLIYYDWMETDMILRLTQKYTVVDLGKLVNYDFYHLDHYQLGASWSGVPHPRDFAKANPDMDLDNPPEAFHPNNENWGLIQYPLEVVPYSPNGGDVETGTLYQPRFEWLAFTLLLLSTGAQIARDNLILSIGTALRSLFSFHSVWRRRARVAWKTICGQPVVDWPRLLTGLWIERNSAEPRNQEDEP